MGFIGLFLRWFGKQDSWIATQRVIFKKKIHEESIVTETCINP